MHEANCCKCKKPVQWSSETRSTVNTLTHGLLHVGVLIWNEKNDDWRIVCRKCIRGWVFK